MALQESVGGHDWVLRQHPIKLRAECSRLTQAGNLLERICHHGGNAGEKPTPNNHRQNRGSSNRRVQSVIVSDGVEFGNDRANQTPGQLWLVSYLSGRGSATQQQQPQHGSRRDLERLAPSCVSLDYLLPCPNVVSELARSRGPCPVDVAPASRGWLRVGGTLHANARWPPGFQAPAVPRSRRLESNRLRRGFSDKMSQAK